VKTIRLASLLALAAFAAAPWDCANGMKESTGKKAAGSGVAAPESGRKEGAHEAAQGVFPPVAKAEPEAAGNPQAPAGLEATDELPPDVPGLGGLAGMDPDSFSPGAEGLDEIVALYTKMGDAAKKKADEQAQAQAGKSLRTTKEISGCLPAKIAGWKTAGKAGVSDQLLGGKTAPMAWRKFTDTGGAAAVVTIIDTLNMPDLRVGFELGRALTLQKTSARQQPVEVEGEPGYLTVRADDTDPEKGKTSKGAILVEDRFIAIASIEDEDDLALVLKVVSSVDIKKLRTLNY